MDNLQITNHDFIIYKDENGNVNVNVLLINHDLWLTQNLIAELFGVARNTITEHINNIFKEGELNEDNTVGKTDEVAKELAYKEYDKFKIEQDKKYISDFDKFISEVNNIQN